MKPVIMYKELTISDLEPSLLKPFMRHQVTDKVWYKNGEHYSIKEDLFVDQWDDQKKIRVIEDLRTCVQNGGIVVGAFLNRTLIGFANVEGLLFGRDKQYVELPYIHVSEQYRGYGIGKELFSLCCDFARRIGASKLYIAAHPSVETQQFYRNIGCLYATEVNEEILSKEPLDIQMEYIL